MREVEDDFHIKISNTIIKVFGITCKSKTPTIKSVIEKGRVVVSVTK